MFSIDKYNNIADFITNSKKSSKIIAISKGHDQTKIENAIKCGLKIFGENRVQEAILKFKEIKTRDKSIKLHLTGPLQTNKVKTALDIFDVFHTIDREKLLKELTKYPDKTKDKSFFIQINTGKETSKSGVYPEKTKEFLDLCHYYGIKNIEGLMCIPPINEDPKKHFKLLKDLSVSLGLKGLSIGMSSDYKDALEFDPSYIRLGTILFGEK